jgi:hypothetical protein
MNALKYGRYTFSCRMLADALLPEYKGSTLRGGFGTAFKRVVCALKHRECDDCLLRATCLYTVVFETSLAVPPDQDLRQSATPHPFVLRPPETVKRQFSEGDELVFDLLLFGDVNARLPYFIYAFHQAGKMGIGRRINGRRPEFRLSRVSSGDSRIYSEDTETIEYADAVEMLSVGRVDTPERSTRVQVTLKTPLRLKFNNRIERDLPFHVLVRAMLRRISSLFTAYAGGEPDLDYKGLLDRAASICTVEKRIYWQDWERYSNRQKQRMPMSGMAGDVTYEGELGEFLPLLDICAKLHIGKNTAFGLGKIESHLLA